MTVKFRGDFDGERVGLAVVVAAREREEQLGRVERELQEQERRKPAARAADEGEREPSRSRAGAKRAGATRSSTGRNRPGRSAVTLTRWLRCFGAPMPST